MSFRAKIILALAALDALFLAIITATTITFFSHLGRARVRAHARTEAALLASAAENGVLAQDLGGLEAIIKEALTNPGITAVRILNRHGKVLVQGAARGHRLIFHKGYWRTPGHAGSFGVTAPITVAGVRYGRVDLAVSLAPLARRLAQARVHMEGVAFIEIELAVFFGFYFGTYLARKLKVLEDAASQVGAGHLGFQAPVTGRDEVSRALVAFNTMSRRLREEMDERLRQDKALKELTANLELHVAQRTEELAAANKALQHLALYDPLCGLPNRIQFARDLDRTLRHAQATQESFAVLALDLNEFKAINDRYGHAAGDEVLRVVGRRLTQAVRASDVVARFGGDEFALLLPSLRGGEAALLAVAAKIQDALAPPIALAAGSGSVGASIGAALFPDHGIDAALLLRRADMAMYWAKRHGQGFRIYDALIEASGTANPVLAALERGAQAGLLAEGFVPHYRPVVGLADGTVVAVEIIPAWQEPRPEFVASADLLLMIAQKGALIPFTLRLFERAIADVAALAAGPARPALLLGLAAAHWQDPDFADAFLECLQALDASFLIVELPLELLVADVPRALRFLDRLRALGGRVAVSGYGTDRAVLGSLDTLPLDIVKIDADLVAELSGPGKGREIVRDLIDLCHRLHYRTLAEGVTSAAAAETLQALSCDYVEGTFVASPMTVPELVQWLSARHHA